MILRGSTAARVAALLTLVACSAPPAVVPTELLGRWVTDDPRFAGRALELAAATVRFESGLEQPTVHAILWVTAGDRGEGGEEVTIGYAGEGDREYRLGLRYRRDADEVRLVNRPGVVWTRQGGA